MLPSVAMLLLFLSPSRSSRLCSHLCQCYEHSDLVDCHARGFEDIPHGLPHGTWLLDLGRNKLTEIRSRAFAGLWSLRILVLSDNSIQFLHTQVRPFIQSIYTLKYNSSLLTLIFHVEPFTKGSKRRFPWNHHFWFSKKNLFKITCEEHFINLKNLLWNLKVPCNH